MPLVTNAEPAVPRHTRPNTAQRRSGTPERDRAPRRQRATNHDVDAQVLALREGGNSFSAIARRLELHRAVDAHRTFLRALGTYAGNDRQQLVDGEEQRLDRLEVRIRTRDSADPEKLKRRLMGVDKFREALRQ
jgi:hypothetical protein